MTLTSHENPASQGAGFLFCAGKVPETNSHTKRHKQPKTAEERKAADPHQRYLLAAKASGLARPLSHRKNLKVRHPALDPPAEALKTKRGTGHKLP